MTLKHAHNKTVTECTEGFWRVEAAKGMMRRDLVLYETEIRKTNGHCKCGVTALPEREQEALLEYATPAALESSLVDCIVMEPQVRVWHNFYLARV